MFYPIRVSLAKSSYTNKLIIGVVALTPFNLVVVRSGIEGIGELEELEGGEGRFRDFVFSG